jgi:cytoskeletal protein CcmA (bactofilin family)
MKFENLLNTTARKESFFISKEMMITGIVKADGPGQIAGIIKGDVSVNNKLVILKEGIILGDVSADELLVYGRIDGDVKSCNKLMIQSGALIKGNISTIEIHIEKDAIIEGVITKAGSQPTLHKNREFPKKKELPVKIIEPPQLPPPSGKKEPGERTAWF